MTDNTVQNGDSWCTNLVRAFSNHFPRMNLMVGGSTANFALKQPSSLDSFFLEEDIANLAMMVYEESIRDHYCFQIPRSFKCTAMMLVEHLLSSVECFTFKSSILLQCFCNMLF